MKVKALVGWSEWRAGSERGGQTDALHMYALPFSTPSISKCQSPQRGMLKCFKPFHTIAFYVHKFCFSVFACVQTQNKSTNQVKHSFLKIILLPSAPSSFHHYI